ncbi:MAG: hypothetical protein RSB81_04645 [Anaerovoracaceae bacterium]
MTRQELYNAVDSLASDIEFSYLSVDGAICPFSREDISVAYGGEECTFNSISDALGAKIVSGESLEDIVEKLEFL